MLKGSLEGLSQLTTPARIARIISGLEHEAVQGNAHAARELGAWLAEFPPQDETLRLEDPPGERRQRRILARLNAEIEQEEAAMTDALAPEDDQPSPLS